MAATREIGSLGALVEERRRVDLALRIAALQVGANGSPRRDDAGELTASVVMEIAPPEREPLPTQPRRRRRRAASSDLHGD